MRRGSPTIVRGTGLGSYYVWQRLQPPLANALIVLVRAWTEQLGYCGCRIYCSSRPGTLMLSLPHAHSASQDFWLDLIKNDALAQKRGLCLSGGSRVHQTSSCKQGSPTPEEHPGGRIRQAAR